jgi:hypothetical protein
MVVLKLFLIREKKSVGNGKNKAMKMMMMMLYLSAAHECKT